MVHLSYRHLTRTLKRDPDDLKKAEKAGITLPPLSYEDEPKRPSIANLTSHLREKHPEKIQATKEEVVAAANKAGTKPEDPAVTEQSEMFMGKWVAKGVEKPQIERTKKGFLYVFAIWLAEEDLPFNTGASPLTFLSSSSLTPSPSLQAKPSLSSRCSDTSSADGLCHHTQQSASLSQICSLAPEMQSFLSFR